MNQEVGKSIASGSDTKLKHFIYLDRNRIQSYTSQFFDGLTQIRRLSETINRKDVKNPPEEYQEEAREKTSSGEGSVGTSLAFKMTGKGDKKRTIKSGIKSPIGSIQESSESKNFSEDKLDHDNLYLLLEQHFIGHKLLNEITDVGCLENSESQIIKITAPTRFFDWLMIHKLLENPNSLRLLMSSSGVDPSEVLPNEVLELMLCLLNVCSVGSITAHLELGDKRILCSLNPEHFVITMDQLRGMYILSGDIEVTIVGFLNKRRLRSDNITGLAGQLDMTDLSKALIGDVDFFVEPIAIYSDFES
jgi:hypothetical protein